MMMATDNSKLIRNYKKLSSSLRKEQSRLLEEVAQHGVLPSKSMRQEIAELELNIAAVENNIIELQDGKSA